MTIVYLAALRQTPPEQVEAAQVEGANGWQVFRYVYMPSILPTILLMYVMIIIFSFLTFDYIYLLTGGGPAHATEMLSTYAYTLGFSSFLVGRASAVGIVMSAFGLADCHLLHLAQSQGHRSMSMSRRVPRMMPHVVLILLAAVALFPLLLVLINSFKTHADVVRNPLALPLQLDLANYAEAWHYGKFSRGFINSIILSSTTIIVVLFCASLAGYVLAGKKIRIWPLIMVYFLIAMTVPIQLFLFPLYFAFARLHLLGNLVATGFVLAAMSLPLSVLLMRTFFLRVPAELEEAARIDGANIRQVLWSIMLPIVSPGLITVAVIVGLQSWNEFLITSTFLQGENNFTATLGFLSMNGTYNVDQGLMMAAAVIMITRPSSCFLSWCSVTSWTDWSAAQSKANGIEPGRRLLAYIDCTDCRADLCGRVGEGYRHLLRAAGSRVGPMTRFAPALARWHFMLPTR